MAHLADELAGNLSYGQQKLLDTAMALVSDPAVAFLDEPAGGVNLTMLGDVERQIRDLNGTGPLKVRSGSTSPVLLLRCHRAPRILRWRPSRQPRSMA